MDWYQKKYRNDAALDATMRKVVEYDQLRTMKPPPRIEPGSPIPPGVTQQQHENAVKNWVEWTQDRDELRRLEECASASAVKVVAVAGAASGMGFAASRTLKQTRARSVLTVLVAGALGASLAFRQWGTQCAVDFLQGDGRIAAKSREWLRQECADHPILKEYEETHGKLTVAENTFAATS